MVDKRGVFCVAGLSARRPHDPTGAGDSFAGGFMGYWRDAVIRVTLRCVAPWSTLGAGELCRRKVWP